MGTEICCRASLLHANDPQAYHYILTDPTVQEHAAEVLHKRSQAFASLLLAAQPMHGFRVFSAPCHPPPSGCNLGRLSLS